jgi:hypothetical protein
VNLTVNETMIKYKCENAGIWVDFMDLLQSTLIPFVLMIIFTSLTIKHVFDSRKLLSINRSVALNSKDNKSKKSSKRFKFAVTTIMNVILFLFMNLPCISINMIKSYTILFENLDKLYVFFNTLAFFFLYLNISLFFFINYFVNSLFKKEFLVILNAIRRKTER